MDRSESLKGEVGTHGTGEQGHRGEALRRVDDRVALRLSRPPVLSLSAASEIEMISDIGEDGGGKDDADDDDSGHSEWSVRSFLDFSEIPSG